MSQDAAYQRCEHAIALLLEQGPAAARLELLAQQVGCSPFQLQREFSAYTGLSPSQFARVLSREALRARLDAQGTAGGSLLALSEASGFSSVSRLHDLTVTLEALTPAQLRAAGAGVEIAYGQVDSPWGPLRLGQTARGICHLQFVDPQEATPAAAALAAQWPQATLVEDPARAQATADALFAAPAQASAPAPAGAGAGASRPLRLALAVRGTNFQVQVWRALLAIPPGSLRTYAAIARGLGLPAGAARAVGNAVGANPVALLIPCHRVIRASGALGGYRWGLPRKAGLLAAEWAGAAGQTSAA